jgi:hypothetical protein
VVWLGAEAGNLRPVFEADLSARQRQRIEAACVDSLIYDKFHIMQHANEAVSEVRHAEFFRKGGAARELIKGKHWLLLTRWVNLTGARNRCCSSCSG